MDRHRLGLIGVAAVPVAFLATFFVYPVVTVLARGVSFDALVDALSNERLQRVLWFTLWQAVASTALTVALALPMAWVLARHRFRGRSLVWALITVPFVLPTIVVATAFVAVLRPLDLVPGVGAVLAAHAYFNIAVVARSVGSALTAVDPTLEDAARVLGASRWRAFRMVSLPIIRPTLVGAASIVFLFAFTSFGVVLVLGGPRRATLDVEIWRQTAQLLDLRTAAALSVVQLLAVLACLALWSRGSGVPVTHRRAPADRPVRGWRSSAVVAGVLVPSLAFVLTPIVTIAVRSLRVDGSFGLAYYRALGTNRRGTTLFVAPADAIRNSLTYAAAATAIAMVIGVLVAVVVAAGRGRVLDRAVMVPLGTSAVTLGLGFLLALDEPPLALRESWWLVPIAHALVAMPFVVRIVLPALRSIDPRLREAAAVLGASPLRTRLAVDVPLVARPALVAAGFAAAVSLGEFGATVFLARPNTPTMPIAIFRFLGQPGAVNLGQSMAMSTLLMAVTALVILGVERFRVGHIGTF